MSSPWLLLGCFCSEHGQSSQPPASCLAVQMLALLGCHLFCFLLGLCLQGQAIPTRAAGETHKSRWCPLFYQSPNREWLRKPAWHKRSILCHSERQQACILHLPFYPRDYPWAFCGCVVHSPHSWVGMPLPDYLRRNSSMA